MLGHCHKDAYSHFFINSVTTLFWLSFLALVRVQGATKRGFVCLSFYWCMEGHIQAVPCDVQAIYLLLPPIPALHVANFCGASVYVLLNSSRSSPRARTVCLACLIYQDVNLPMLFCFGGNGWLCHFCSSQRVSGWHRGLTRVPLLGLLCQLFPSVPQIPPRCCESPEL